MCKCWFCAQACQMRPGDAASFAKANAAEECKKRPLCVVFPKLRRQTASSRGRIRCRAGALFTSERCWGNSPL